MALQILTFWLLLHLMYQKVAARGARVAQSFKCLILSQVIISQLMSLNSTSGPVLSVWSLLQIPCSPLLSALLMLSLSLKNK